MSERSAIFRSLLGNAFLVILKVVCGIIFSSYALIADAVHSTSDLVSDLGVMIGVKKSYEPADDEHPFGHGKFEYILTLFIGVMIILVAYNLIKSIIVRWNDVVVIPDYIIIVFIILVMLIKLVLSRYLIRVGKELKSDIILASGEESSTDVISSFFVLVGIIFVFIGNKFNIDIFLQADKIASILIGLFIFRIAFKIIKRAVKSIMGIQVDNDIYNEYYNIILNVDGVISVEKLDMVLYGPFYQILVDIGIDGSLILNDAHEIATNVQTLLLDINKVCYVKVHMEPIIK